LAAINAWMKIEVERKTGNGNSVGKRLLTDDVIGNDETVPPPKVQVPTTLNFFFFVADDEVK
jgi:hypothetical protein